MTKDSRITYRRNKSYRTVSNKYTIVRTPGARLTILYKKKSAQLPKCGESGVPLQGLPKIRSTALRRLSKRQRRVSRPYGGSLSGKTVRERILRAFLLEEVKLIKQLTASAAVKKEGKAKRRKGAAKK